MVSVLLLGFLWFRLFVYGFDLLLVWFGGICLWFNLLIAVNSVEFWFVLWCLLFTCGCV